MAKGIWRTTNKYEIFNRPLPKQAYGLEKCLELYSFQPHGLKIIYQIHNRFLKNNLVICLIFAIFTVYIYEKNYFFHYTT